MHMTECVINYRNEIINYLNIKIDYTGWGKSPATILIAYNFVQRKDKSVWFSYNVYLVFTFFLRYD